VADVLEHVMTGLGPCIEGHRPVHLFEDAEVDDRLRCPAAGQGAA
jgi:hypothetical protein